MSGSLKFLRARRLGRTNIVVFNGLLRTEMVIAVDTEAAFDLPPYPYLTFNALLSFILTSFTPAVVGFPNATPIDRLTYISL